MHHDDAQRTATLTQKRLGFSDGGRTQIVSISQARTISVNNAFSQDMF